VLNPFGSGDPGVGISLFSGNSQGGGFFDAATDTSGNYTFTGVPVGAYRVLSSDPAQQWVGDTLDHITQDQQNQTTNVQLSPATWAQLSPFGTLPSVRSGQGAVYDPGSNRMIIFGSGISYNNDTWV